MNPSLFVYITIKGALCSFGEENQTQNCNIYNINEVIKHTLKYLFSITE